LFVFKGIYSSLCHCEQGEAIPKKRQRNLFFSFIQARLLENATLLKAEELLVLSIIDTK